MIVCVVDHLHQLNGTLSSLIRIPQGGVPSYSALNKLAKQIDTCSMGGWSSNADRLYLFISHLATRSCILCIPISMYLSGIDLAMLESKCCLCSVLSTSRMHKYGKYNLKTLLVVTQSAVFFQNEKMQTNKVIKPETTHAFNRSSLHLPMNCNWWMHSFFFQKFLVYQSHGFQSSWFFLRGFPLSFVTIKMKQKYYHTSMALSLDGSE